MMGLTVDLIDDVLVVAGIAWMVVRQFQWRDAARMRTIGLALLGLGIVLLMQEMLTSAARWTAKDGAVLAGELVLTAGLGIVMGGRYRLRGAGAAVQARLERSGVVLWGLFLLVRLGSFAFAHHLGATLIESTGALLLSFSVNRLSAALVVGHRTGVPAVAPS